MKLGIGVWFSFLGNFLFKFLGSKIHILFGINLDPLSTLFIGIVGGKICGYAGSKIN